MNQPRRPRLSRRIVRLLGMFAVLCAGLSAFAAVNINALAQQTQSLVTHEAAALRGVADAQEHLARMHQLAFQMNDADSGELPTLQAAFDEEAQGAVSDMASVRGIATGAGAQFYRDAVGGVAAYAAAWSKTKARLVQGDKDGAEAMLQQSGSLTFDRADRAFDGLIASQMRDLNRAALAAQARAANALLVMVGGALLGLVSVGAVALWTVQKQLTEPLGDVTQAMMRLARGDLSGAFEHQPRGDEIGDLSLAFGAFRQAALDKIKAEAARAGATKDQAAVVEALGAALAGLAAGDLVSRLGGTFAQGYEKLRCDFNGAIDQLQDAMTRIEATALGIREGAGAISTSAEDLSLRTERQAASLEESAAALEQISSTIRRTAEGSAEASRMVQAAKADAKRSGQVVRDAVNAMGEIEQSALQIARITSVINDIAVQTNLLALNAGVEAARAGKAGPGFAIVASEVRALAQRSAAAAKEIKALISASGRQVTAGVTLVGQAGQSLERILFNIDEISRLAEESAAAAGEQSLSLREVSSAIDQMSHVTQQNACMVEENTAASLTLASESQQLATLIGRFGIGAPPTVVRPTAQPAAPPQRRSPAPPIRVAAMAHGGEVAAHDWEQF